MDLQIGMYCRDIDGNIFKMTEWFDEDHTQICTDDGLEYIEYIKKASFNIIDLIEAGDYVNEFQVSDIIQHTYITEFRGPNDYDYSEMQTCLELSDNSEWGVDYCFNHQIKEILTKEQYNNNCYRLE